MGVACPKCSKGEITVKKSRRGKAFYGCSNYPKCDAVFWDKPVAIPCPQCKTPFLLDKTRKDGTTRYCQNEGCDYKIAVTGVNVTDAGASDAKVSAN